MIRYLAIPWFMPVVVLSAAPAGPSEKQDLLCFKNGDQLHGKFMGVSAGPLAQWKRDDMSGPVEFKTSEIRQVVLRGARPLKSLESLSNVALINGDCVPGTITGIDDENITLQTGYAGVLRIPRKQVAMLAPNPLGGRIYYHGPFVENEWKMIHPSFPDGLPDPVPAGEEKEADEQPGRWEFSGSAWYWQDKRTGTALAREAVMPERSVLSFELAWKNQLSLVIAIHADFKKVKPGEPAKNDNDAIKRNMRIRQFVPGDASGLPLVFGNSNIIQIYSNYMMLIRSHVDAEGKPTSERIQMNNEHIRLGDRNHARVEIRSTRSTGRISLFIDDELATQWEGENSGEKAEPDDKPTGFGFLAQGAETPVRISDIIVSEWNGMPDSARSMQVDKQDVVLMTNGVDRFAGHVGGLNAQGKVLFNGKLGKFEFPLEDVAEVRFARKNLAEASDPASDHWTIRFNPMGSISGRPVSGDASTLGIVSPILGDLKVSTDAAVLFELTPSKTTIDDWDAAF